ncbi:MAG: YceI family protein [Bacteriovoracaceae bacterium]
MKLLALTLTLLFSITTWAKNNVNIHVALTPAGSFNAVTDKVRGKIVKTDTGFHSKRIEINIQNLKTGIDLRDEHLWEHLNSKTHSKATLTELKATNGNATAMLEVNGVKVPVSINYVDSGNVVDANFKVKASDFKLPPKSYLGVGVSDEVSINVKMGYK